MRFRKLRIAWSVGWGLACVLMIALWMQSYWAGFSMTLPKTDDWLASSKGWIGLLYCGGPFESVLRVRFRVPYWLPIGSAVALSTGPWLPWWPNRFSLRTLLIATTLVAVVLGLVIYAARD